MTEIDRLAVASLGDRYGISRSVLYSRINALKIEPEKLGNRAFVSGGQLALLDGLHDHLKDGGSTAEFLEIKGLDDEKPSGKPSGEQSAGQITFSPDAGQLLNLLAEQQHTEQSAEQSNLHWTERLRCLEEAYEKGWLLSTSQLAELLGISSHTLTSFHECDRYGFHLSRAGMNGAEIAWKVGKAQKKK
jgi:hypothetical protein